jgi:hypothetical protein
MSHNYDAYPEGHIYVTSKLLWHSGIIIMYNRSRKLRHFYGAVIKIKICKQICYQQNKITETFHLECNWCTYLL